jgi:segregation and condensation protein A
VKVGYKVKLKDFEGPLDLLLFLIRESEIDIWDIPIVEVTSQYQTWMEDLETIDLELAGDFLLMSATLLQIKARMLLPQEEKVDGEQVDPREQLVERLLEYRQFREVAEHLKDRESRFSDTYRRRFFDLSWVDPEIRDETLEDVDIFSIAQAWMEISVRPKRTTRHEVDLFQFTVDDQIRSIRSRIETEAAFPMRRLLNDDDDKHLLVVSFLAVLDLAKRKEILARQADPRQDVWIFNPSRMKDWLKELRDYV